MSVDVNSMKMLDSLCHPMTVIAEAEALRPGLRRASCFFYGGRDDVGGAGDGPVRL
jgi:hypothetical protein